MRVNGISSVRFYTPVFRARVSLSSDDKFEKSQALSYYEKLNKDMGILKEKDIKLMAQKIQKRVKDVPLDDVYYTMGVLSEFSSYKSWDKFKKIFKDMNVNSIRPNVRDGSKGEGVGLSYVMSYLNEKNCRDLMYSCRKSIVMLDSKLLKKLSQNKEIENHEHYFYIKNFENGYNFLNQGESFEDFTTNVLKKIKNKGDIKTSLDEYLNGKNMEMIKELGIKATIVSANTVATPQKIADNLNPIIISYSDFVDFLNTNNDDFIFDFMNKMNLLITQRKLSQDLKKLHSKIKQVTNNSDNVYYAVLDTTKSFGLINYMYQKINNIPDKNFILNEDPTFINHLEKGSYVVMLDDASISSSTILNDRFDYNNFKIMLHKPDIKLVFAPVYVTDYAKDLISKALRGKDLFVYEKMLPHCSSQILDKVNLPSLVEELNGNFLTSFVLPYMGPDTNCTDYRKFYEKMLYCPEAQQIL